MAVKTKSSPAVRLREKPRVVTRAVGNVVLSIEYWNEPGFVYIGMRDIRFHKNLNEHDPLIEFFFKKFSRHRAAWELSDFLWDTQILQLINGSPAKDDVIHAAVDGILELLP